MHVDQRESECLVGVHAARAKRGDERLAVQQVIGIAHRVLARAAALDALRIEDVRVLLGRGTIAEARADDEVVPSLPILWVHRPVDQADELLQEIVVLRTDFLNRDDVKLPDDVDQRCHDGFVARFLLSEGPDVERCDANCRAGADGRRGNAARGLHDGRRLWNGPSRLRGRRPRETAAGVPCARLLRRGTGSSAN